MEIVNVRIDERLIHGQIVTVWISHLKATRIVIVDDKAASDEIQKMALKLACPTTVKLSILSTERAYEKILNEAYVDDKVFIIFKNPKSLKKFTDLGYTFKNINIGNMSGKQGSIQIKKAVSVSFEEAQILLDYANNGVNLEAKMVPSDSDVNVVNLLKGVSN